MLRIAPNEAERPEFELDLDKIARLGAQRMLIGALDFEVELYLEGARADRDERGHALVNRNGRARTRKVVCGAGTLEVSAPRVNDRRVDESTGEPLRFKSKVLPPYVRRSPKVAEVLPILYLHGLSTGDFVPALKEFFGSECGLSASAINRLTTSWQAEREQFMKRNLKDCDYVYIWVDGIVRHEALLRPGGMRDPPSTCRSRPMKLTAA